MSKPMFKDGFYLTSAGSATGAFLNGFSVTVLSLSINSIIGYHTKFSAGTPPTSNFLVFYFLV
jgi:hypothetical protein